jgi:hypothetical protein
MSRPFYYDVNMLQGTKEELDGIFVNICIDTVVYCRKFYILKQEHFSIISTLTEMNNEKSFAHWHSISAIICCYWNQHPSKTETKEIFVKCLPLENLFTSVSSDCLSWRLISSGSHENVNFNKVLVFLYTKQRIYEY